MTPKPATERRGALRGTIVSGLAVAGLCAAFWIVEAFGGGKGTLLATNAQARDIAAATEAPAKHESAVIEHDSEATTATETAQAHEAAKPLFQDNPMVALSGTLREKQADLDKREAALAVREKQLLALQAELDATLKKTQATRDEMDKLAGAAEAKRKQELAQWITIHETMKPAQSAQMIGEMEDDFAMELLAGMDVKKSSKILSELVMKNKTKATALAHRLEAQNK